MMKRFLQISLIVLFAMALPAFATVLVSSPSNGATVGSSVQFIATANTTTCSQGVASMGIYVDNKIDYVANGTSVNTTLSMASGTHTVAVQEWDLCGGSTATPLTLTVSTAAGVSVSLPVSGSTVTSPASFVATASSTCSKGVAAMGIYVDGVLQYKVNGASLNTTLGLSTGAQSPVVQEWDYCGGSSNKAVNVTVSGAVGKTISNVQALSGWNQWGELAPVYDICTAPCNGAVTLSMNQHDSALSLDGNSTQFNLGGTTPYSDALWSNPVLGQGNLQGLNDPSHVLLPTLHNFTLDTYVYVTDLAVTQDLEFDINWYMNGVGLEWGTQCNHLADGSWDIWDNVDAKWFSTGIPCALNNSAWNHVVLQVQRESNNDLLYQTITVNGVVNNINQIVAPFPVPSGWYGMTVNYQMDGNSKQAANTTYLDKTNFTYW
jgi:hypothetical protein